MVNILIFLAIGFFIWIGTQSKKIVFVFFMDIQAALGTIGVVSHFSKTTDSLSMTIWDLDYQTNQNGIITF
jgi:hypothetical protein